MATKLIVLFAAGVFVAALVHSLRAGADASREREARVKSGDAPAHEPRLLGPRARELAVAPGIWSAWKPYPALAREPATVLWRTEGTVSRVSLAGERGGARLVVRFGPSPVLPTLAGAGLDWKRPGREWGSHLVFPTAGVWTVRVRADRREGAVRVRVVEPRPARGASRNADSAAGARNASEARTQGASICGHIGATEDAASCRVAAAGGAGRPFRTGP